MLAGLVPSGGSSCELLPHLLQLLEAALIPWLVAPPHVPQTSCPVIAALLSTPIACISDRKTLVIILDSRIISSSQHLYPKHIYRFLLP